MFANICACHCFIVLLPLCKQSPRSCVCSAGQPFCIHCSAVGWALYPIPEAFLALYAQYASSFLQLRPNFQPQLPVRTSVPRYAYICYSQRDIRVSLLGNNLSSLIRSSFLPLSSPFLTGLRLAEQLARREDEAKIRHRLGLSLWASGNLEEAQHQVKHLSRLPLPALNHLDFSSALSEFPPENPTFGVSWPPISPHLLALQVDNAFIWGVGGETENEWETSFQFKAYGGGNISKGKRRTGEDEKQWWL